MRKFRLIKTYPGSPNLGDKIMILDACVNYCKCCTLEDLQRLPKFEDVINSPEFWEEIIPKPEYVKCIRNERPDINYGVVGKIYKVADWNHSINDCMIEGSNKGSSAKNRFEPSTKYEYELQNRKPLFTTEEGIDIFEGDTYYTIWNTDISIIILKDTIYGPHTCHKDMGREAIRSTQCKYFKIKYNAQKYLEDNKKYSLDDITLAYSRIAEVHSPLFYNLIESLKRL